MKQRFLTEAEFSRLKEKFPTVSIAEGTRPTIYVGGGELIPLVQFLKAELAFTHLSCLTAVDFKDAIDVVYYLFSEPLDACACVKVRLDRERPVVPSLTSVFPGAEFEEREVYDLMGVCFSGHPDLRRILMPEDFEGHPLRKDFVYKKPAPPRAIRMGTRKEAEA